MLSEAKPAGGLRSSLLRAAYTEDQRRRALAAAAALVAAASLAAAAPLLPPVLPLTAALMLAVAATAWFGGSAWGAAAAIGAPLIRLGVGAQVGAGAEPAMEFVGAAASALLLMVPAWLVPPARAAANRDRESSHTDPLTGLGNRRFFYEVAALEVNRTRRYSRPLALAYIDCDGFEAVNQRRGYAAGDAILKQIAGALRSSLRASDTVARIAGDEFALLLPETPGDGAAVVVDKIRERLEQATSATPDRIGFSIVVVGYGSGALAASELLRQADATMIELKRQARGSTRRIDYVHPELTAL